MWVLKQKQGLWHYYGTDSAAGLCGTRLPDLGTTRTQQAKPNGFDGLLCNRCWFRQELEQTLDAMPLDANRLWLETLNFGGLTEFDTDRLYAEIGEERADTLRIIFSLAESTEVESEAPAEPMVIPEPPRLALADLTAIPLLIRQPAIAESGPAEPDEEFMTASPLSEPRLKINCSRLPKERSASGFFRLFRRKDGL